MSRIVTCLDCPMYQKGGYCRHTRKDVGALSPACAYAIALNAKFNPEDDQDEPELFAPVPASDPTPEPAKTVETPTKLCPKCGRVLPHYDFHPKLEAKDGLQSWCKKCNREDARQRAEQRRAEKAAAREAEKNATTKVCRTCGRELPISEYYLKHGKPDIHCKDCVKKYNVKTAKARRDARSAAANVGATTKVCKTCGRELPLDAFSAHAKTWDHKFTVCKECMVDRLRKNRKNKTKKEDTMTDKEIQSAILMPDTEATMSPKTSGEPNVSPIEPQPETTAEHRPRQDPRLENFESKALADELRARGYRVTAARPITIIEEL